MNIAIVIAGGAGKRTGQNIPKQFLTVYDKPIIIYTLEALAKCSQIDKIVVCVLDGWQNFIEGYIKQFNIQKIHKIVKGGESRFHSIYNGVNCCSTFAKSNDIIVLLDANRPLISEHVLNEAIAKAKKNGCVLTVRPCYDSMFIWREDKICNIPRETLLRGITPDAFSLKNINEICEKALKCRLTNMSISSLALEFGENIVINEGNAESFKITTAEDIELFKAVINSEAPVYLKK